jgi:hypothetical protein
MKDKTELQLKVENLQVELQDLEESIDSFGVSPIDASNDLVRLDRKRKELQELEEQLELL